MCGEPRQHVELNIVWREVADAYCEFERSHCRVRNDLEENRLCHVKRMRIVTIAYKAQGFVARVRNHRKRPAADRRGNASARWRRSAGGHDTFGRHFERG